MQASVLSVTPNMGLRTNNIIHYQLSPDELILQTSERKQGKLNNTGALVINTGEFTGRSPKDKFIVKDNITASTVFWNEFNIPIDEKYFDSLYRKMTRYLSDKELWIRDCYVCADEQFKLKLRVINEEPSGNLFAHNMFLRPDNDELENFEPEWKVIQAPGFKADSITDGTRQHNFAIISFTKKMILVGGTGYTGEIKKGVFTILNYLLPQNKNVLSMHCSANMGEDGDTAIFFGLSGTGKTTLSTDPKRFLIGDDEHGWADNTVFNFEGGCYAKVIDLCPEKEPEIFHAVKHGALVENVDFFNETDIINFNSKKITENTRVSYPIHYISNALDLSIGNIPNNIFFLTCDAYGVLPPISKLTTGQAMYQFISGYTAKVAGTEADVKEPKATFSACFGAPFLPLHPGKYAAMLGHKLNEHEVNVWMINTGWIGGAYGTGKRIPLEYTRAMINAVLEEKLNDVEYIAHPVFGMMVPQQCPGVSSEILNPENTWSDKESYGVAAKNLAKQFIKNFEKYADGVSDDVLAAAPKV